VNDLNKVFKRVNKEIKRVISDPKIMKSFGEDAVNIIKVRTSQGFGVNRNEGQKQKLAELKDSTIEYRKRYKRRLAPGAGPAKSRLTFTGEMLDSIGFKPLARTVKIFLKGKHKNSNVTNEELAAIHHRGRSDMAARPFLYLAKKEIDTLIESLRREVKKRLRKFR
jgi:ABC-type Fe3+-citrate transport system substrate-binding protein